MNKYEKINNINMKKKLYKQWYQKEKDILKRIYGTVIEYRGSNNEVYEVYTSIPDFDKIRSEKTRLKVINSDLRIRKFLKNYEEGPKDKIQSPQNKSRNKRAKIINALRRSKRR